MPNVITSSTNARLKTLSKLARQTKERKVQAAFVVEGAHLVETLLRANYKLQHLFVPESRADHAEVERIYKGIASNNVSLVTGSLLSRVSTLQNTNDIAAIFKHQPPHTLPATADIIVLEGVQDPGNVGTILRSAVASGIQHVVCDLQTAEPFSPKVLRAGMGAHAWLNIHVVDDLSACLSGLQSTIYATTLHRDSVPLYSLNLTKSSAWLFGNEGNGLSETLWRLAHHKVIIPMSGNSESLNVAMAATVCLFEQQRQRLK